MPRDLSLPYIFPFWKGDNCLSGVVGLAVQTFCFSGQFFAPGKPALVCPEHLINAEESSESLDPPFMKKLLGFEGR